MKNYDAYLWAAYGIGLGLMLWVLVAAWWSHRRQVKKLCQQWSEDEA
jgi:heme exporter protein CcmD